MVEAMGAVNVGAVGLELLMSEPSAVGQRYNKAMVMLALEQCAPMALKPSLLELSALKLSELEQSVR
jgi:hypothetical protein